MRRCPSGDVSSLLYRQWLKEEWLFELLALMQEEKNIDMNNEYEINFPVRVHFVSIVYTDLVEDSMFATKPTTVL